ncbi:MAG: hypothetical protein JRF55_08850 [Deltaproteobacteria bacterium]|nr:hypothetical protein [Deltaproteobacteria bacterium]
MARFLYLVLFVSFLIAPSGVVHADEGMEATGAEATETEATESKAAEESSEAAAEEAEKPVKTFGPDYPVRFARRPLVLAEGMVRADGRLTVGGVTGTGTFSALDLGGAVSPIENLEVGLSTELTGAVPAPGGNSLISIIFSPQASYGDIPVYARYKFLESGSAQLAVDFMLVLPTNTDFQMRAAMPMRVIEMFGFVTLDSSLAIGYRNGDKYAAFIPDPGYIEIGGGVALVNVGGGDGAKNVLELPFYVGGGYTYEGKVLVDIFSQFGFEPLMTANGPAGIDTFNVGDDWYITLGASVHTKSLFGKNKK